MLVSAKEMLQKAKAGHYAVGQFNINNLEWTKAILTVNPNITGLSTFVIFAVAPFNLLKGVLVSLIVLAIYKKISPIFRMR